MNESATVYGRKPQMLHTETEVNRKKWISYETEKKYKSWHAQKSW